MTSTPISNSLIHQWIRDGDFHSWKHSIESGQWSPLMLCEHDGQNWIQTLMGSSHSLPFWQWILNPNHASYFFGLSQWSRESFRPIPSWIHVLKMLQGCLNRGWKRATIQCIGDLSRSCLDSSVLPERSKPPLPPQETGLGIATLWMYCLDLHAQFEEERPPFNIPSEDLKVYRSEFSQWLGALSVDLYELLTESEKIRWIEASLHWNITSRWWKSYRLAWNVSRNVGPTGLSPRDMQQLTWIDSMVSSWILNWTDEYRPLYPVHDRRNALQRARSLWIRQQDESSDWLHKLHQSWTPSKLHWDPLKIQAYHQWIGFDPHWISTSSPNPPTKSLPLNTFEHCFNPPSPCALVLTLSQWAQGYTHLQRSNPNLSLSLPWRIFLSQVNLSRWNSLHEHGLLNPELYILKEWSVENPHRLEALEKPDYLNQLKKQEGFLTILKNRQEACIHRINLIRTHLQAMNLPDQTPSANPPETLVTLQQAQQWWDECIQKEHPRIQIKVPIRMDLWWVLKFLTHNSSDLYPYSKLKHPIQPDQLRICYQEYSDTRDWVRTVTQSTWSKSVAQPLTSWNCKSFGPEARHQFLTNAGLGLYFIHDETKRREFQLEEKTFHEHQSLKQDLAQQLSSKSSPSNEDSSDASRGRRL